MQGSYFIMGKIGNKEIVKEDIKTFIKSTKELDWTTNPIYRGATNAKVTPTFSLNKNQDNTITKFSENVFSNYLVNENGLLDNYYNFCSQYENQNLRVFDKIEANKQKLCQSGGIRDSSIKEEIISNLNNNWKKAVTNSSELSNLLIPYRAYLNNNDYN